MISNFPLIIADLLNCLIFSFICFFNLIFLSFFSVLPFFLCLSFWCNLYPACYDLFCPGLLLFLAMLRFPVELYFCCCCCFFHKSMKQTLTEKETCKRCCFYVYTLYRSSFPYIHCDTLETSMYFIRILSDTSEQGGL